MIELIFVYKAKSQELQSRNLRLLISELPPKKDGVLHTEKGTVERLQLTTDTSD